MVERKSLSDVYDAVYDEERPQTQIRAIAIDPLGTQINVANENRQGNVSTVYFTRDLSAQGYKLL